MSATLDRTLEKHKDLFGWEAAMPRCKEEILRDYARVLRARLNLRKYAELRRLGLRPTTNWRGATRAGDDYPVRCGRPGAGMAVHSEERPPYGPGAKTGAGGRHIRDLAECGVAAIGNVLWLFSRYRPICGGEEKGAYRIWPLTEGSKYHTVWPESIRRFPGVTE